MFLLIHTPISLSCKTFLHAHTLLLSLEVNQECLILVPNPDKWNISRYRKMWVVFLFFLGSKKKKILGVHKREGKGLKFQYILWVDFMGFWGEVPQDIPGGLVILKNAIGMHAGKLQPLWSLNPHTNTAFLGKFLQVPFAAWGSQQR